jgi:hypothetical protein
MTIVKQHPGMYCSLPCLCLFLLATQPLQRCVAQSPTVQPTAPPELTIALGSLRAPENQIPLNATRDLTFKFVNPNKSAALMNVSVTNTLPSPLEVDSAMPPKDDPNSPCNPGTVNASGQSISISGITLAAGATCTYNIPVVAAGSTVSDATNTPAVVNATPTAAVVGSGIPATTQISAIWNEAGCMAAPAGQVKPVDSTKATYFVRSLLSRAYQAEAYTMNPIDTPNYANDPSVFRVTPDQYGDSIGQLKPTYVSGLVYIDAAAFVTTEAQALYNDIRTKVWGTYGDPGALFDVEISLTVDKTGKRYTAVTLNEAMNRINCQLHPDAWFLDFYSDAEKKDPELVTTAIQFAQEHNQMVGGNIFFSQTAADTSIPAIPQGSDFAAFVDDGNNQTTPFQYGYGFNDANVMKFAGEADSSTVILGHLQSNAQNMYEGTEACYYNNYTPPPNPDPSGPEQPPPPVVNWGENTHQDYLHLWASSQTGDKFTFMYPVFYPVCPAADAFNPLTDENVNGTDHTILYNAITDLMNTYNKSPQ